MHKNDIFIAMHTNRKLIVSTIKRHTYFEYLFSAKVRKRYLKCAAENKNNALCINIFIKMVVVLKNGVSLRIFMSWLQV